MALRIYPPIGLARLGNNLEQFYVGPESPGHPGVEIDAQGGETTLSAYKVDGDQIKRQGARFRLFEVPGDGSAPHELELPPGSVVEWTVHLVNKKAAVVRRGSPPSSPARPQLAADPNPFLIDPGPRAISGANSSGVTFDTGEFEGRRVPLGELRTDARQNLIVLGGFGFSSSPRSQPLPSFYTNPGWHDDTADGPVTARILHADGRTEEVAVSAWVMVGPPDYAPAIQGVVTLYDIMTEVAVDNLGVPTPSQASFTGDIFPLLHRARRLQWVNQAFDWETISDDWEALADATNAAGQLRAENAQHLRAGVLRLSNVQLTRIQQGHLDRWIAGDFLPDWAGEPQAAATVTPFGMTRAALDSTVGQGFFPGIEAGIIVRDPTLYSAPFEYRLDQATLSPGDLTALMAVPWQADFYDCSTVWWPSQRPDRVRTSPASDARADWARGVAGHLGMVMNFSKLGFITAQQDPLGNVVFTETQHQDLTFFIA